MQVKFNTIEGKDNDFIKRVAKQADLIVEGGSGTRMWPLTDFRKFGFKGPYFRMDLTYSDKFPGTLDTYISNEGRTSEYWSLGSNCFRKEHMLPLVEKFSSKNLSFVSCKALANALFDHKNLNHWEKKSSEDVIPIPEAVEVLSELPCKTQLHFYPAGFGTIVSKEYATFFDSIRDVSYIEPYDGLLILDLNNVDIENHEHTERFKSFIEESAKKDWQFFLPKKDYDFIYMTKS